MSRSADALRRRKVRGMDLWVEIEESHGALMEEQNISAGRAAGRPAGDAARGAARGAGSSLPGGPDAGGDCGHAGCAAGHGEEPPAARAEAAAGQGRRAI